MFVHPRVDILLKLCSTNTKFLVMHPSSFISGAFYVDCGDKDVIKFYDNPQNMISPSPTPNSYSFEDVAYRCIPARLIMFKSDFMHGCPALVGERKIVISFNFGLHNAS